MDTMKSESSQSPVSAQTIPVLVDGAALEHRLLRSLLILVEDTMVSRTDWLKSVPPDAQSFRLSITVSAIGEQPTSESLISTTQPGTSSPMNPSAPDSSESQSQASTTTEQPEPPAPPSSPTPQSPIDELGFDPSWQHVHRGNHYKNCDQCQMPYGARQHQKIINGEAWPITGADNLRVSAKREAKPFA